MPDQIPETAGRYDGPALLHAGYVKTASTYLQRHVFADAGLGFGLPGGAESRAWLVDWFRAGDPYGYDPGRVEAGMAELEEPLRRQGLIPVWSEETLLGDPLTRAYCGAESARRIAALARPLKGFITIREQRAFCLSAYAEHLKSHRHSLTDFIGTGREARSFRPILEPHFLAYSAAVARWQEVLGPGNLLVLPVELLAADPEDYAARLMGFLGRPAPPALPRAASNRSRGGTAMAVARVLNRAFVKSPLGTPPSVAERAAQKTVRLVDRLSPRALDAALLGRWKAQIAARYDGVFEADNRRLETLIGQDLGRFGYPRG